MQPSYPGIVRIGYILADNLPAYIIQRAIVGLPINLFLQPRDIPLSGNAECSVEATNDCNGTIESVTLTFRTIMPLPTQRAIAFVLTDANGLQWIIGQLERPHLVITATRDLGTPDGKPAVITYEVKHTALTALKPCKIMV